MVAGGAVMGVTAYFGYKGMYALSLVSVPLLLVLAGWVTWRSLEEVGGWCGLAAIEPTEHDDRRGGRHRRRRHVRLRRHAGTELDPLRPHPDGRASGPAWSRSSSASC